MRTSRSGLLLALAILLTHAGLARAQCPGGGSPDPICVPTATCTRYGNDPARYDPADVAVVPSCFGGALLGPLADRNATPRYACLYQPTSIPTAPLPLVVYLHPSLATADSVWQVTNLTTFVNSANVTDDSSRPGFILLAPEGRKTCHYYPQPDQRQPGWDNWYRNLDPSDVAENVDAWAIDSFVAQQVASGRVDTNRIYVTGWSNGAAMGYLYGLSRPSIAAIAVYSAPDPWHAFNDPCPQVPVVNGSSTVDRYRLANPGAPTMHVHNDCDIVGLCPNGERLTRLLLPLDIGVQDAIIDSATLPTNGCVDACGTDPNASYDPCTNPLGSTVGVGNHVRWPDDWAPAILDFFRVHPLGARGR